MELITLPALKISAPPGDSLEARVGNTPLLPLHRITSNLSPAVRVYAKAEWFNPSGSIKDRAAINILHHALADGSLSKGKRLLDSTSGNMGIAYATFGAALGIGVTLTMPSNASPERIKILRLLGAELILTDPLEGTDGAMKIAKELALQSPGRYYYANQYDNPANWKAHLEHTGPELLQQTNGEITHFVAGLGTTGTLTGVARCFGKYKPDTQIIAVQPDSPYHGLEGLKHLATASVPGIFDPRLPDRTVAVSTEEAFAMVRRLGREEGLFVGISSGAAAVAAMKIAETLDHGLIVAVFPDSGYKYLSDDVLWTEQQTEKKDKPSDNPANT